MYVVVDDSKLNADAGYQEYKAGTALEANHAVNADNATNATTAGKVGHSLTVQYVNVNNLGATMGSTSTFDGSADVTVNSYNAAAGASVSSARERATSTTGRSWTVIPAWFISISILYTSSSEHSPARTRLLAS